MANCDDGVNLAGVVGIRFSTSGDARCAQRQDGRCLGAMAIF
ncbi:hypothetical protein TIFTF001_009327, partial [Ficus carica]